MNENNLTEYSIGIAANTKALSYLKIPQLISLIGARSEVGDSCHIRKNTKNENRFVNVCGTANKDNFNSVIDDLIIFFNEEYDAELLGCGLRLVIGVFMAKGEFSVSTYFETGMLEALSKLNMDLDVEMYPWSEEYC